MIESSIKFPRELVNNFDATKTREIGSNIRINRISLIERLKYSFDHHNIQYSKKLSTIR